MSNFKNCRHECLMNIYLLLSIMMLRKKYQRSIYGTKQFLISIIDTLYSLIKFTKIVHSKIFDYYINKV